MLATKRILLLFATAFALAACGGDSNLGPRGTAAVPDHPGPNTPITAENGEFVVGQTIASLGGLFQRYLSHAMQQASAAKVTVHGQSLNGLRLDGLASGYVTLNNAAYSFNGTTHVLAGDLSFTDFSDTNALFVGGPLTFEMRLTPLTEQTDLRTFYDMDGSLAYAGSYKGAMDLNFTIDIGGGTSIYDGTITVDGQQVVLGQ